MRACVCAAHKQKAFRFMASSLMRFCFTVCVRQEKKYYVAQRKLNWNNWVEIWKIWITMNSKLVRRQQKRRRKSSRIKVEERTENEKKKSSAILFCWWSKLKMWTIIATAWPMHVIFCRGVTDDEEKWEREKKKVLSYKFHIVVVWRRVVAKLRRRRIRWLQECSYRIRYRPL